MEARFPHLVETQPELLAEHFTEGGIIEKAIEYCLKAGLRSRDRFAHVEAISHLTKGLELLETMDASPRRDARELELLGPLGTAYIASRGYAAPEVGPVFSRARALCERVGQTPQLFAMMWGNFAFHIVRGDFQVCTELADEAMAFGERLNDPGILMEALFLRGLTRLSRRFCRGSRLLCAGDRRLRRPRTHGVLGRARRRECRRHFPLLSGASLCGILVFRTKRCESAARCSSSRAPSASPSALNTHCIIRPGSASIVEWGRRRRKPATSKSELRRSKGFHSGTPRARSTPPLACCCRADWSKGFGCCKRALNPTEARAPNWRSLIT